MSTPYLILFSWNCPGLNKAFEPERHVFTIFLQYLAIDVCPWMFNDTGNTLKVSVRLPDESLSRRVLSPVIHLF